MIDPSNIRKLVEKFLSGYTRNPHYHDLVSEGCLAALKASRTYDAKHPSGASFATYLRAVIRNATKRYLDRNAHPVAVPPDPAPQDADRARQAPFNISDSADGIPSDADHHLTPERLALQRLILETFQLSYFILPQRNIARDIIFLKAMERIETLKKNRTKSSRQFPDAVLFQLSVCRTALDAYGFLLDPATNLVGYTDDDKRALTAYARGQPVTKASRIVWSLVKLVTDAALSRYPATTPIAVVVGSVLHGAPYKRYHRFLNDDRAEKKQQQASAIRQKALDSLSPLYDPVVFEECDDETIPLVERIFRHLVPQQTSHFSKERRDSYVGADHRRWDRFDVLDHWHAFICSRCLGFARLVRGVRPMVPKSFSDNDEDFDKDRERTTDPLRSEEVERLDEQLKDARSRRKHYGTGPLTIVADGRERVAQFDPAESRAIEFRMPSDEVAFLEFYGADDDGDFLLAVVPMQGLENGDATRFKLDNGQKLAVSVTTGKDQPARVQVRRASWLPSPFAKRSPGMRRLLAGSVGSLNRKLRPGQVLRPVLISALIGLLVWNVSDNAQSNAKLQNAKRRNVKLQNENAELKIAVGRFGIDMPEIEYMRGASVPDASIRYAEELTRAGNVEKALTLLERVYGPYGRHNLVVAVVRTLTEMNELGKAAAVAANIAEAETRSHAFQYVASAQARAGRIEDSLKTATTAIEKASRRHATLSEIAGVMASIGRFQEARELAGTIERGGGGTDAFRRIGLHYAAGGQVEEALGIAHNEMEDGLAREAVLGKAARALALQGRFQEAVEVTDTMDNDMYTARDWSLVEIAWIQAMEGHVDDALETARAIERGQDWDSAMYKIVWALVSMKRLKEARALAAGIKDKVRREFTLDEIHYAQKASMARPPAVEKIKSD